MATFLSSSFHLTKAAAAVSEKSMEGAAMPLIAKSVLKMNEDAGMPVMKSTKRHATVS